MWVYDLFLVLFGIVIGVAAAAPLKNLFSGKYRKNKIQRKRVQLLTQLRKNPEDKKTAGQLNTEVFHEKEKEEVVEQLLQEIAETELIYSKERHGKIYWKFDQKAYNRNKHKFHA